MLQILYKRKLKQFTREVLENYQKKNDMTLKAKQITSVQDSLRKLIINTKLL